MKNLKYIFMVLLGGTLYGTMSSLVKLSYSRGFTAAEISFWQAAIAAALLGCCALASRRHEPGACSRRDIAEMLLTGVAIGMTNLTYYKSVAYIPASLAIVLLMQYAWISLLLERAVFGRRASRAEVVATAAILGGTLLASGALEGGMAGSVAPAGVALALTSSLTYAIYIMANGRVATHAGWRRKSALIMTGSAAGILAASGTAVAGAECASGEFAIWALLLSLGGTTIPTALFAAGISRVGAGPSAIIMTVELPVATMCAHFLLGEPLTPLRVAGVAVMLGAIAALNYSKATKKKE